MHDDLDAMDNASLMTFVKEVRSLLTGGKEQGVNSPEFWGLFKKIRYAEEVMKFRNLPVSDERLGPRFGLPEFRDHVLHSTEITDQKTEVG